MEPNQPADPLQIFATVVLDHTIDEKWAGQPHETFKNLPNTSKGDAGEEFIRAYAESLGFEVAQRTGRLGQWDVEINRIKFEVKLASEDISGSFQFNHIRYDTRYDYLLCLGVSPDDLHFNIWSKADIATGEAGNLVTMGKGQNASFKLTKRLLELRPIQEFKEAIEGLTQP